MAAVAVVAAQGGLSRRVHERWCGWLWMTMYSLEYEAVLMILAQSPMSCQDPFRNTFLVPEEESKVLFAAKHATPRPLGSPF
jgi:hypothetical protein